ncbi:MAG: TolC family protein [Planctomycetota bacterium]|jgi:outer membrane protein TolC
MPLFRTIFSWFCFVAVAAGALILSGCKTPEEFKQDADEEVYSILDEKWQSQHGFKANYRVSDVAAEPNDLIFDPNWIPSGPLTLPQAVAIATANNRDYKSRKESLYTTTLTLTLARHGYVTRWFGSIDGRYQRNGDDEFVSSDGNLGFNRLFADGTQISAGIAADWLRYLTGDPDTSLGSVLTASFRHPLLRGSTREVVQENLTQSERNVLYQIRSFSRYRKQFVVTIVSGYLRTLQSRDSVTNAENNYESLKSAYDEAALRAKGGKLPPLEADQTKQRLLQAEDNLARAQRSYQQALDSFKLLLAIPVDNEIELDSGVLEQISQMQISEPAFNVADAVETALQTRMDLATSYDQVDDARRKIDISADALRAQLDLVGSLNVDSTPDTEIGKLRFEDGAYGIGAELDLPLDKKSERNAYRRTLLSLLESQRDYERSVDEVKLEVRNDYNSLIEASRRYEIQKMSLKLARERVNSTSMLLQAGRVQSRELLDSQDDLLSAQNDRTSTLVDYMIAKLNFYRDIGILQVKPDGLWQSLDTENETLF